MSIIDFCQNVSLELSLFEVIIFLFAMVIVTEIVLVVKKLVLALKKQRKIDTRLKETRDRISKVVTEIESYKDRASEVEIKAEETTQIKLNDTKQLIEQIKPNALGEEALKGKKTRAMSMEERWAEYDKKRSMRSTASGRLLL